VSIIVIRLTRWIQGCFDSRVLLRRYHFATP